MHWRLGHLIHADKHGFLVIPGEDEGRLLEAARFMDANECRTMIAAARGSAGRTTGDILRGLDEAGAVFRVAARERFGVRGEW
jgi:regulator of RNase E activity RraA